MTGSATPPTPSGPVPVLLTFGHGTLDRDGIVGALRAGGVHRLVDVRRFPGSRRHPHVASDALAQWLPDAGVGYRWEPRLGGRRRTPPADASTPEPDPWWQVDAFRAYAAHTRTPEFVAAMDALLAEVRAAPGGVAVMCSETVWWRCHRRLVADVAVLLHDVAVDHLGHDGRRAPHRPSAGARVTPGGLVYDRPTEA